MMAAPFIIAVVDDDRRILESLGNLLESADYAVRLFSTATALLDDSSCLAEIDCLITDIGLPAMDGVELARLAQVARPALPTILITGQFDTLDRLSAVGLGPYRLFKKPFDGQQVLTAISDVLHGARLRTPEG